MFKQPVWPEDYLKQIKVDVTKSMAESTSMTGEEFIAWFKQSFSKDDIAPMIKFMDTAYDDIDISRDCAKYFLGEYMQWLKYHKNDVPDEFVDFKTFLSDALKWMDEE